ncbi:hypothetical protein [uncultured Microbacterium sp.]|uniref:hypothetical protein n=1 Tax=uncultured Microbacterium sp. TaxID=191216 RepID=UPI0028EED3C9|nr:hypothetical protein [uncultured Microbacterium sp.]
MRINTLDEARNWLSSRLSDLHIAERSGDAARIRLAQMRVEAAESTLREITLRDEGGWRP